MRMHKRGRIRLLALLLVFAVIAAACGDDDDSTPATDPPASGDDSAAAADGDDGDDGATSDDGDDGATSDDGDDGATSDDGNDGATLVDGDDPTVDQGETPGSYPDAELVVSRWAGDPWTAAQMASAERWANRTGADVSFDAIPYETLHDKQVLESTSGGVYDIMYVHPSWFGEFVDAGFLYPIDDFLANADLNPGGAGPEAYLPSVLSQGASGGVQYCLPDFVSTIVLAYRVDLFEAAGIAEPVTLDDIVAAAAALDSDDIAGITLPGKRTGATADVMSTLITAFGTWWFDDDGLTSLDVDAATSAVEFYASVAPYTPPGLLNFHLDEAATAAAQGQAAMIISTTPSLSALEDPERSNTVGQWDYVAIAADASRPSGELIYWNWCIGAESSDPEAAYSFLRSWTSGEEQAEVAVVAGTAGATHDFYENESLLEQLPFLTAMQNALTNANAQPSLPTWPQAQEEIELQVQAAIEGDVTPAEAAANMRSALEEILG